MLFKIQITLIALATLILVSVAGIERAEARHCWSGQRAHVGYNLSCGGQRAHEGYNIHRDYRAHEGYDVRRSYRTRRGYNTRRYRNNFRSGHHRSGFIIELNFGGSRPQVEPWYVQAESVRYVQVQPVQAVLHVQPSQVSLSNCASRYTREYTTTIKIGGEDKPAHGRICWQPDGSWEIMPDTVQQDR